MYKFVRVSVLVIFSAGLLTGCSQQKLSPVELQDKAACVAYAKRDSSPRHAFIAYELRFAKTKAKNLSKLPGFIAKKLAIQAALDVYSINHDKSVLRKIPGFPANPSGHPSSLFDPFETEVETIIRVNELRKVPGVCKALGSPIK